MEKRKKIGFFLGPAVFFLVYFSSILKGKPAAHSLLAVFSLVVIWWITECIPIPITALLIPVMLTYFKIASPEEAFAPFAHPIILLFLGSFILAKAMSVNELDRKLALTLLSKKHFSSTKTRILITLGLSSAVLSLCISNTATTAMMFPIVLGVLSGINKTTSETGNASFKHTLLLMIAYSASVGGIGTPIGSPPNLIAIGMMENLMAYKMTFFHWMILGFMVLIPMFLYLFLVMNLKLKKRGCLSSVSFQISSLSLKKGLSRSQVNVLIAFSVTVTLWIIPGVFALIGGKSSPSFLWFQNHLPESSAALIGAALLFLLPVDLKKGKFTLTLKEALKIDWGTLLLFGGGLSLGTQMFKTGLAESIGRFFISPGDSVNVFFITLVSIIFSVFLTEITSNTASANMIIPIVIAISEAGGVNPLPPVIGSAIGCSFAFLLPVATPPNAIIFGSGMVPLPEMLKHGIWLNIGGIIIIFIVIGLLAPLMGLI